MVKRLVLELEKDMHRRAKIKAAKENKPMREILLNLLTNWLDDDLKKIKKV